MSKPSAEHLLQPDAAELILCNTEEFACETYIFEPSPGEQKLGCLFAAAETENRDGIGSELLDTIVSAVQKEYYRDKQRSPETSFEMALHQANLILHDAAEQGLRDWMRHFHVSIAALAGHNLHVSIAGDAHIFIARKGNISEVSEGLSQSTITDPLQTFSQVASGEIQPRDSLFLTTSAFTSVFRPVDVTRLTLDPSAENVSMRLGQMYRDQRQTVPMAFVTVTLLPQYIAKPTTQAASPTPKRNTTPLSQEQLKPRQPLQINRSTFQRILLFVAQIAVTAWKMIQLKLWPALKSGTVKSGHAVRTVSKFTGRGVSSLANRKRDAVDQGGSVTLRAPSISRDSVKSGIVTGIARAAALPTSAKQTFGSLPRTSKIFGVLSLILLLGLGVSVLLLQQKRSSDEDIERASELLHVTTTKTEAAETALIYDNREQADGLLAEASTLVDELTSTGLYQEEVAALQKEITGHHDRLQRITRIDEQGATLITDLGTVLPEPPKTLFLADATLYTVHPKNNSIITVNPEDGATNTVHETTANIGFVTGGTTHVSDRTLVLNTSPAGIALYDTVDKTLTSQDIAFSTDQPQISSVAVYGNRLYVYDKAEQQIFTHNKTLRGYSSGSAWITDDSFPKNDIQSIAIDGSIYTLHTDGTIRELFKGEGAEYLQDKIDPPLAGATKLLTNEDMKNVYVADPTNRRVVIFSKQGALVKQFVIDSVATVTDIAVSTDESTLYVLDGTRIVSISLAP